MSERKNLPTHAQFILRSTSAADYGADVLGGPIHVGNPYVSAYPGRVGEQSFLPGVDYLGHTWHVVQKHHVADLEVGEAVSAVFSLGGSSGTYLIHRIA